MESESAKYQERLTKFRADLAAKNMLNRWGGQAVEEWKYKQELHDYLALGYVQDAFETCRLYDVPITQPFCDCLLKAVADMLEAWYQQTLKAQGQGLPGSVSIPLAVRQQGSRSSKGIMPRIRVMVETAHVDDAKKRAETGKQRQEHKSIADDIHTENGRKAVGERTETKPVLKEVTSLQSNIDVFISHSSADAVIAQELIDLLRAAIPSLPPEVIRCTSVPGYRLQGGAKTEDQLLEESLRAKVFIALLSKQSLESTYVLFELGARWGAGKYFIPLVVAGMTASQLRPPLSGRHAHSASVEDQLFQLVDEVAAELGFQLAKAPVYTAQLKKLTDVSAEGAKKRLLPPTPITIENRDRKPNIRFVETRVATAQRGEKDGQIHESPQGLGDFQIAIVCFRNEAVVGQRVQQPSVKAHILYRSKDGKEVTDVPRAVWLSEYGEETLFETGKKRCLIVFLLSNQDTLKKLWKETYTTSTSWMAGGPLFRILDEGIRGDIASVEISLLVGDVCILSATFQAQPRERGKLPELILNSLSPAQE